MSDATNRVEVRAQRCIGDRRARVVVHLPAALDERIEEIAERIAGLMNEIQDED